MSSLVKQDMVRAVEDSLIQAATNGQLKSRISDEGLKKMLEQMSADGGSDFNSTKPKKVVIQRRKMKGFEDDDDNDDDLL